MRYPDAVHNANILGRRQGDAQAAWYFDGHDHPTREDFLKVLKGIRDCDPEIMDSFPSGHLSGEMADDMTPNKLYEELGLSERNLRNWAESNQLDEICTAYEHGWDEGYQWAVEQNCLDELRHTVTFVISVEVDEQSPNELLNKLTDLLAKENCSLEMDKVISDEDGEEVRY